MSVAGDSVDGLGNVGVTAGGRRDAAVSVRYTRFVAAMRKLLPLAAAALVGIVVAWPQLLPEERVEVEYSAVDIGGAGLAARVENPRFYGFDGKRRPFSVVADSAQQSKRDGAVVLATPRADLTLEDGSGVLLDARTGAYHQKRQILDLRGDVNLYYDKGYELHTQQARIDVAAGSAAGEHPVEGHGPSIQLGGEGFRLVDRGRIIELTGRSRVLLYPRNDQR